MGSGKRLRGSEASWSQALKSLDFQPGMGPLSRMYNNIQLASKLSSGCDYALFKVSPASPPPPCPQGTGGLILPSFLPHRGFGGGVLRTASLRVKYNFRSEDRSAEAWTECLT